MLKQGRFLGCDAMLDRQGQPKFRKHQFWIWGSHDDDYEEGGCDVVQLEESPTFRRESTEYVACFWWFLAWLILRPWRWRRYIPPQSQSLSERHGITTLKTVLFMLHLLLLSWRSKQQVPPKRWYLSNRVHGVTSHKTAILPFAYVIDSNAVLDNFPSSRKPTKPLRSGNLYSQP
jgi:hypothetical protein